MHWAPEARYLEQGRVKNLLPRPGARHKTRGIDLVTLELFFFVWVDYIWFSFVIRRCRMIWALTFARCVGLRATCNISVAPPNREFTSRFMSLPCLTRTPATCVVSSFILYLGTAVGLCIYFAANPFFFIIISPRAGKVIGMNEAKACNVTSYDYVGDPWNSRLLYRTRDYLEVRSQKLRSSTGAGAGVRVYRFACSHYMISRMIYIGA